MRKGFSKFYKKSLLSFLVLFSATIIFAGFVSAEEGAKTTGTSISISPVNRVFQLSADSEYDDVLSVTNDGSEPVKFEVYAAPYSYVYSEADNGYVLGFNKENNYTQIARWISVMDKSGNYTERPTFTAKPGETIDVNYRISTPKSIPDGGQYAVLFAHTISDPSSTAGIKTEASPGMVIYGRSDGKAEISSEISDLEIKQAIEKEVDVEDGDKSTRKNMTLNHINASAKIKNTGNVDFNARGKLKVESIFGGVYYETPEDGGGMISVIPEAELVLSDEWEDTPSFGLYRVTWTVTTIDSEQTIEKTVFLVSPPIIILSIILLTAIITWVIIGFKRRKEHKSRFSA